MNEGMNERTNEGRSDQKKRGTDEQTVGQEEGWTIRGTKKHSKAQELTLSL